MCRGFRNQAKRRSAGRRRAPVVGQRRPSGIHPPAQKGATTRYDSIRTDSSRIQPNRYDTDSTRHYSNRYDTTRTEPIRRDSIRTYATRTRSDTTQYNWTRSGPIQYNWTPNVVIIFSGLGVRFCERTPARVDRPDIRLQAAGPRRL